MIVHHKSHNSDYSIYYSYIYRCDGTVNRTLTLFRVIIAVMTDISDNMSCDNHLRTDYMRLPQNFGFVWFYSEDKLVFSSFSDSQTCHL